MKKKSLSAKKKVHNSTLKYLNNPKILKIFKEFKNTLNIKENFAVAVSGGSDSLSLAFLAKCYSLIKQLDVKFYIVDHKLRKNSSSEAKLVSLNLKKFDIFFILPTQIFFENRRNSHNFRLTQVRLMNSIHLSFFLFDHLNN